MTAHVAVSVCSTAGEPGTIERAGGQAAGLLAAVQTLRDARGEVDSPYDKAERDAVIETLRDLLGADRFAAQREEGRSLSLQEVTERAVALLESLDIPDRAPATSQTA